MDSPEREFQEKSLADLQAENQQLREKIEQMAVDMSDQLSHLKDQSSKVSDQMKAYAPIAEDVWGLRVFEKAKSYLIGWITLGGVTALMAGLALFAGAWKYTTDFIGTKMESVSEEQIKEIVRKQAEEQVTRYFRDHNAEYLAQVTQMTQESIQRFVITVQSTRGYGGIVSSETGESPSIGIGPILDYTAKMGNVRQMGQEAGVVGFAIAYALEYQIFKTAGQRVRLSPREIYNLARKLENTLSYDSGALVSDGIKVVRTEGAVQEEVWPYEVGEISAQPPARFATATRYKVKRARKLASNVEQIKAELSDTGPIVAGITVYKSMQGGDTKKSGLVPMPKPKEEVLGGTAICIVGYDDTKKLFKFINQWGDDWGDHGYGYIPYDFIKDNSADIWALSL